MEPGKRRRSLGRGRKRRFKDGSQGNNGKGGYHYANKQEVPNLTQEI
jgi:hypothetical protein